MIFDDEPLENFSDDFKEDELGRNKFASSIADAIINYDSKNNLVVGITGEWGYGKTTLINMILKGLNDHIIPKSEKMIFPVRVTNKFLELFSFGHTDDSKGILVFNFNPWYFSEQDQLLSYFFLELNAQIKKIDGFKHLSKKIEPYAAHILATIGIFIAPQRTQATITYLDKIGYFDKDADFQTLKEDLFNSLAAQNKKLLIVIDDIDRLDSKEIKEIFKLIKLIANFPNTIYLVSFDRKVVESALKEGPISGKEYLKKIVPVMFEIPGIANKEIKDQFFEMISSLKDLNETESDMLHDLFDSGFKYFFNNIRDIKRFFNTLNFTYNTVKDDVYFIDFVAITAIHVFQPELYKQIRNNMNLFAIFQGHSLQDEKIRSDINDMLNNIFGDGNLRIDIINFLSIIFPKLSKIFKNTDNSSFYPKWMSQKRIFHEDYFYRYFKFYVPEWDVSIREINELLEMDTNTFVNFLKSKEKSKLILSEIYWLIKHKEINSIYVENIFKGILLYGDQISDDIDFRYSEKSEIRRILTLIYNKVGPASFLNLFKSFVSSNNVCTVCDYAETLFDDRDYLDENLDSNQRDELSDFLCSKITDILSSDLENIQNPWIILDFYKRHCNVDLGTVISNLSFKEFILLLSNIFDLNQSLEENVGRIEKNYIIKDNLNVIKEKFDNIRGSTEFQVDSEFENEFLDLLEKILGQVSITYN